MANTGNGQVSFRYSLAQSNGYETDEFSEALIAIDGVLIGTLGNDYLLQVFGDGDGGVAGSSNGWLNINLDLGSLSAGSHTLSIGGYNNKKTSSTEFTEMWIDQVLLTATDPSVSNSGPTVLINIPDNLSLSSGSTVLLNASATDSEDGNLAAAIQWSSDLDGALGSGNNLSANLSVGTHTLSASVTDSGSATGSDSIIVTITPSD